MVTLRCFFAIEINLVQCILSGQYVLAERFLRNSGYLVECKVMLTFGCQFPSKRSFEKSKSVLKFDFEMVALKCFFAIKISLVQCILQVYVVKIYWPKDF